MTRLDGTPWTLADDDKSKWDKTGDEAKPDPTPEPEPAPEPEPEPTPEPEPAPRPWPDPEIPLYLSPIHERVSGDSQRLRFKYDLDGDHYEIDAEQKLIDPYTFEGNFNYWRPENFIHLEF